MDTIDSRKNDYILYGCGGGIFILVIVIVGLIVALIQKDEERKQHQQNLIYEKQSHSQCKRELAQYQQVIAEIQQQDQLQKQMEQQQQQQQTPQPRAQIAGVPLDQIPSQYHVGTSGTHNTRGGTLEGSTGDSLEDINLRRQLQIKPRMSPMKKGQHFQPL